MKKFFKEFKTFITRGNVLDMAVGVVVGGAFSKIVTSLVNNIIMPAIAALFGGKSVADLKWVISPEIVDDAGKVVKAEAAIGYGLFIQNIIDFLLIAFVLFCVLRVVMMLQNGTASERQIRKALTREEKAKLKAEGKTYKEIREAAIQKLADEKARKEQEEAAKKASIETTDDILKDIRSLLSEKKDAE